MKLLLTSNGVANKSIANSLRKLLGKPFNKSKLVFIPTAANSSAEDKQWLIRDLYNVAELGFKKINILNIDATPQEKIWRPRLEEADIILVGGGNTFYLMHWLKKSGLAKALPNLLKKKVYVGISAGSIVTGPNLKALKLYYGKEGTGQNDESLRMVPFHFRSHFNSASFPKARTGYLSKITKQLKEPMYAMDDNSAVEVVDGKIKIISEGEYLVINPIEDQLKKEGFKHIYEWKDKPNTKYPPHKHKGKVALYITDGGLSFFMDGKIIRLKKGDRFNVPVGKLHAAKVTKDGCSYIVGEMIKGDS